MEQTICHSWELFKIRGKCQMVLRSTLATVTKPLILFLCDEAEKYGFDAVKRKAYVASLFKLRAYLKQKLRAFT